MDLPNGEVSVYGLVGELCKRFYEKHTPEEHPYLPRKDNSVAVKKLKSRAFEILLKKSAKNNDDVESRNADPVAELLKYAFVLKTALRRVSKAEELEYSLDGLSEDGVDSHSGVYSTLQFLNALKSLEIKDENALTVFHYGRANPLLPEELRNPKGVPKYQIYPMESLLVPEKFEAMLGVESDCSGRDKCGVARSNLSFGSQFRSAATLGIETLSSQSEQTLGSMLSVPRYTVRLVSTRQFSMSSYFAPETMETQDDARDEYSTGLIGRIPGSEMPLLCVKSARTNEETNSELSDGQSTIIRFDEKIYDVVNSSIVEWEKVNYFPDVTEHRTWEFLGHFEAPKEPSFLTETRGAMLHLEIIEQAGFLPLLSKNVVESLNSIEEVPTREFLKRIKLLLLGVESESFTWNENTGFSLRENTTIPGVSAKALRNSCSELAYWGGCYRSLSKMIKPDPQTGKMLQDGLIFCAMCNSVKELLIYYQAVILRIVVDGPDAPPAFLRLIANVRPIGCLISEVARLCRCDRNDQSVLGEGLGLLSHIYEHVTRVTKPTVALVFYSILKSCCEVYFRMLQKWIFEGICDDPHGEFMIKIRPQFLRERSHRFWTKGFGINVNSLPGFLGHLADQILDCGKTVKLLKICDPKNSICTMFTTVHPSVRVCLSVGMIREQEIICREFFSNGEKILGNDVSFSRAFDEHRIAEKERVDLVVEAQRETLLRIKREREEAKKRVAQDKRRLLAQLKDQAEEVATRKEKERAAELLKDKQFLKDIDDAEKIAKIAELAEKRVVLNYYNELAAEAERRRLRADWRSKRMKLFEKRLNVIDRAKTELSGIEEMDSVESSSPIFPKNDENLADNEKTGKIMENKIEDDKKLTTEPEKLEKMMENKIEGDKKITTEPEKLKFTSSQDENENSTKPETIEIVGIEEPEVVATTKISADVVEKIVEETETKPNKSPRPCVLDINRTRMMSGSNFGNLNDYRETAKTTNVNLENLSNRPKDLPLNTDDNATVARRNKLRVLHQEYGMTPNNNEFNIIVMDAQGNENHICIDASTVKPDNFRRTTEIEKNSNNSNDRLTDVEKNRNKNMSHYTEDNEKFVRPRVIGETVDPTEAQRNRKRNTTHTYNEPPPDGESSRSVNFEIRTELQRNRAKIMGHDEKNYHDYESVTDHSETNCSEPPTPLGQPLNDDGVTPMSCTTDTFSLSMSSSITQYQNCDDDCSKNLIDGATTPNDVDDDPVAESRPSTGYDFPRGNQTFPRFFGLEAAATPVFESSLTVRDVEMIDNTSLQAYLERSVTIPLRIQSRLANAALIKYMIHEMKILSHLHSLRSFFFLLNGEFAKSLMGSLYKRLYEISAPIELFRSSSLTNILENALNSSLSNSYANSELLSLSANDVPTQLQVSNPEFLNCLCMNYKISWPLNIILDERVMQQYSKVFKFLLMVGRVLYVLQEDFHILKVDRKSATSDRYHKLQLYRHSMMQFITALHNYLTCTVLHASWAVFEKELENATTLDQIYMTHVNYIKKILSRCMLTARGEKMRNFLCNIFKIILKFHNRVRSENWSREGRDCGREHFERLEKMYRTFCEARAYLAHVANKLASSGYQPHLTHFLNALNINPLYDLTGTTGSGKKC